MINVVLSLLSIAAGIGSLVCFVLIIIAFFTNDEQTLGIVCLVGIVVCGIGGLIAFVMGWVKSSELGVQQIMMAWTGCIVASMLFSLLGSFL